MRLKRHALILTITLLSASVTRPADAGWRWTPEIGRFVRVGRYVVLTPEEQFAQAQDFYKDGRYGRAASTYNNFLDDYPDNPMADQAQFGIAESYEARGKLVKAGEEYQKLIVNYPESDLYGFLETELIRGRNEVEATLREARREIEDFLKR